MNTRTQHSSTAPARPYRAVRSRLLLVLPLWLAFSDSSSAAGPWALVTNDNRGVVHTVDLSTVPATVHGPFLSGELGSGSLVDAAAEPNGRYVLVTNYDDERLYRIDMLDPLHPQVAGSIDVGVVSEEVAVAPNGAFAIVAASQFGDRLVAIDLADFTIVGTHLLAEPVAVTCVEIAPDNRTVIFCDSATESLRYGLFDPVLGFESISSFGLESDPVNAAVAPDGATVLATGLGLSVNVFRIAAPGSLVRGIPSSVQLSSSSLYHQSIAFSPTGDRAYVVSTAGLGQGDFDTLSWIGITGPGRIGSWQSEAATLVTRSPLYSYLGADILTVVPDGSVAYVGNNFIPQTVSALSRVDLSNFAVTTLSFGVGMRPTATAIPKCIFCDGLEGGSPWAWSYTASGAAASSERTRPAEPGAGR